MFVTDFSVKRKKISNMFGLNTISWSQFLLYDFVICIIIDFILVLYTILSAKREGEKSTSEIRLRRSSLTNIRQ